LKQAFDFDIEFIWMTITVWDDESIGTKDIQWPYIEPWMLLHEMGKSPQATTSCLWGDVPESEIGTFWEHCHQHCKWMRTHPMDTRETDWPVTIPLRSHGDGARFCKNSKLLIFSSGSIFARGYSWDTKYIYTVIPCELMVGSITLNQILVHLGKSLRALANPDGTCPTHDIDGVDFPENSRRWNLRGHRICGKFLFSWVGMKGDNEWIQQVVQSKRI
jgi:hypothetical protein